MHNSLIITLLLFRVFIPAQAQLAYNKGFEILKSKKSFRYWQVDTKDGQYMFSAENKHVRSGKYSMLIDGQNATRSQSDLEGGYFYTSALREFIGGGKELRLDAWVKTDTPFTRASIWFDQANSNNKISQQMITTDSVKLVKGWQHLKILSALSPATNVISFGGQLNGKGKVWFDDFELSVDGKPIKDLASAFPKIKPEAIAWLKKHAVSLNSVDSTDNDNDLDSLSKWIGEARVVGIGEPTHGTSEVMRFRLRLFQYLVKKKGFNTLMIEDKLPEAGLMNDYVIGGKDTALSLLKKYFFQIGRNEELLNLIEWMRKYNADHPNKLQFRGMDMQSVRVAIPNIERFAKQHDSSLAQLMVLIKSTTVNLNSNKDTSKTKIIVDSLINFSSNIKDYINKNFSLFSKSVPEDTLKWLVLNASVLVQYYQDYIGKTVSFRDSCMAKNIKDYCEQYPNAKLLLWAHSGHITRTPMKMGDWLNKYIKHLYFPVAFATAKGTYTASIDYQGSEYKVYPLEELYLGTVENYMQYAGLSNCIIPLNREITHKAPDFTSKSLDFRSIGFMNLNSQFASTILGTNYEALIYMEKTTHSKSFMLKKD